MSTEDTKKVEKQEPVAWAVISRGRRHKVYFEHSDALAHFEQLSKFATANSSLNILDIQIAPLGNYAPHPCPECENLKAKIDLTNTLAQQSNQDHLNVRKDYQGEIIKLKAERDELAEKLKTEKTNALILKYRDDQIPDVYNTFEIQAMSDNARKFVDKADWDRLKVLCGNQQVRIDELAEQVEKMRKDIQRHCRYINSDYESCCGICGNKLTEEHHPDCSMSLPDISTSILTSVRAEAGKC